MANTKTKAVVAIGLLDLARQVAKGWNARQQAQRGALGFGKGFATDARTLARDTRARVSDVNVPRVEWGWPPVVRRQPTALERMKSWGPLAVLVSLASLAVVVTAHIVAKREETDDPQLARSDSRVKGAIVASSKAIDTGVQKVVDGGTHAATGTAAAVAATTGIAKQAVVDKAKAEVDEKVVKPAKKKLVLYGTLGFVALTVYVVVLATLVQLAVGALQ